MTGYNHEKKIIASGIILLLIISSIIYFSIPVPIISEPENVKINLITAINSEYDRIEITPKIDCDKVLQIIENYKRSRLPHPLACHPLTVGETDILIFGDKGNFIISLSKDDDYSVNVVYTSAEKGGYSIHNSAKLYDEVSALINN